jgi:hypothetical protein
VAGDEPLAGRQQLLRISPILLKTVPTRSYENLYREKRRFPFNGSLQHRILQGRSPRPQNQSLASIIYPNVIKLLVTEVELHAALV